MAQQGGNGGGDAIGTDSFGDHSVEGFGNTVVSQSAPQDPLVGQVLDGRYRIERILGEGGMGIVYKAVHTTLGKPLAVKVLRAEVSRDEQIVARFRQEAQSASAIGNQHIIDISDFGSLPDGSTYFVMEFLSGQSLTDALEQGKLETARIIAIAKQLCNALGNAHEIGIVHRDLKPDNIQLVQRGENQDFVKVLDFGIAKVGGGNSKLTQAGQVFGTPHYMSPEQCAGTNVDHRTDIYALGIILYEMATGKVPFDADNLMGILTKHLYENPIPPHELPPPHDVSSALEAVIMKALAKTPEARYQTMAELARDLDSVSAGETPTAVVEQLDRGSFSGQRNTARSTTGLSIGVGGPSLPVKKPLTPILIAVGALVVVVGGGLVFALGGSDESDMQAISPSDVRPANDVPAADPMDSVPEVLKPETEPKVEVEPEKNAKVATVKVTTQPTGAGVYDGDALLGNTPLELSKPPGGEGATLHLRSPGYKDQTIRISSLTANSISVSLEKVPEPKVQAPASSRRRAARSQPKPKPKAVQEAPKPAKRPGLGPSSEVLDPWQ